VQECAPSFGASSRHLDYITTNMSDECTPLLERVDSGVGLELERVESNDFPEILRGKRLLLGTESLGPVNGVSRTTLSLIQYLRRNGVQVAVLAPQFEGKPSRLQHKDDIEIRLHGCPLPYNPELSVVYPFRVDRVYAKSFDPELVYLASPASLGFQFLLQMRQQKIPPAVLCNFQTDLSAYGEIMFPAPFGNISAWVLKFVQGYLFRHPMVKTVFYPSTGVKKYLVKAGVQPEKLMPLGRGVNTDLFNPSARDESYRKELAPNGEIILVCVARLGAEKGFDFLAQVALKLAAKGFLFKLLIVGGNRNSSVVEDVHRLFKDVKDSVIFTGFLDGQDLARAYASADIFCHTSVTETFGLVVLEAMASGVPVIARDAGGPSDTIEHGSCGYLIPPEDLNSFIACIEKLSTDAEHRLSMSAVARIFACEATWDKINNRVAWQLADALERNSRPTQLSEGYARSPIANTSYGIFLRDNDITSLFVSLIVGARVNGALGIIFAVWGWLILGWSMVTFMPMIRQRVSHLFNLLEGPFQGCY
jgi:glycosyltransferase involved in cell wall biosynthesis